MKLTKSEAKADLLMISAYILVRMKTQIELWVESQVQLKNQLEQLKLLEHFYFFSDSASSKWFFDLQTK